MSQVNVIVIHVRAKQAAEYEKFFVERQLPRWRDFQRRGKFISARFFRSQFGSDERKAVVKYPEGPLVFGGDLIHSVG